MKKETKIILGVAIACIIIVGAILYIKEKDNGAYSKEIEETETKNEDVKKYANEIVTMEIKLGLYFEGEEPKSYKANEEEIYQIMGIIESLKFRKETCDGMNDYVITVTDNIGNSKGYGIEVYDVETHIVVTGNGEAVITGKEKAVIDKICANARDSEVKFLNQTLGFKIRKALRNDESTAKLFATNDGGKTYSEVEFIRSKEMPERKTIFTDLFPKIEDGILKVNAFTMNDGSYEPRRSAYEYISKDNGKTFEFSKVLLVQ